MWQKWPCIACKHQENHRCWYIIHERDQEVKARRIRQNSTYYADNWRTEVDTWYWLLQSYEYLMNISRRGYRWQHNRKHLIKEMEKYEKVISHDLVRITGIAHDSLSNQTPRRQTKPEAIDGQRYACPYHHHHHCNVRQSNGSKRNNVL